VKHSKTFKNEKGAKVEFKMKSECSTPEEMRETLRFMAQSAHGFYLEIAEKFNSSL